MLYKLVYVRFGKTKFEPSRLKVLKLEGSCYEVPISTENEYYKRIFVAKRQIPPKWCDRFKFVLRVTLKFQE